MRQVQVFKWEQQVIDRCRQSVKVPDFTAVFHQFGQEADGEGQANPVAIIETPDGQVHSAYIGLVKFLEVAPGANDGLIKALREVAKFGSAEGYIAMRALNDAGIA